MVLSELTELKGFILVSEESHDLWYTSVAQNENKSTPESVFELRLKIIKETL